MAKVAWKSLRKLNSLGEYLGKILIVASVIFFVIFLLSLFFYNSFSLNKSPSGLAATGVLFLVLVVGLFFYSNYPKHRQVVIGLMKFFSILMGFIITTQVALVPLIAPRISIEDSTMRSATLRGDESFKADEVTIRVRPPLFPMFYYVEIPVAYSNSTSIYSLDRNPLLKVSKAGNMLRVGVLTDGWTVEDIKTRVYIEHEAYLSKQGLLYSFVKTLQSYETIIGLQQKSGLEFKYSLKNNENFTINLVDWYVSIDPENNPELWREFLRLTDSKKKCIQFYNKVEDVVDNYKVATVRTSPKLSTDYLNKDEIPHTVLQNNQPFNLRLLGSVEPNQQLDFFIHAYAFPCNS